MSVNNNHKAGVPAVQNTMADMSVDDAQIRGVRYHEIQARKAYRLADAIYNNFTEAELDRFGTAEERCQLLGLFAYQLMEVANINRVVSDRKSPCFSWYHGFSDVEHSTKGWYSGLPASISWDMASQ